MEIFWPCFCEKLMKKDEIVVLTLRLIFCIFHYVMLLGGGGVWENVTICYREEGGV